MGDRKSFQDSFRKSTGYEEEAPRNPGDEEAARRATNEANDPEAPKSAHLSGWKSFQDSFRKKNGQ